MDVSDKDAIHRWRCRQGYPCSLDIVVNAHSNHLDSNPRIPHLPPYILIYLNASNLTEKEVPYLLLRKVHRLQLQILAYVIRHFLMDRHPFF